MPYDYIWAQKKGKFFERHYQKKRVRTILSMANFNGKTVLDIGCNTGVLTFKMENLGAKCYGIDISDVNIKNALKYKKSNSTRNATQEVHQPTAPDCPQGITIQPIRADVGRTSPPIMVNDG